MKNKISTILVASLMFTGILAGCQATASEDQSVESNETTTSTGNSQSSVDYDITFSSDDLEVGYDESAITTIELTDDQSTSSGEGVTIEGNVVTIESGGSYLISGTLSDGQINVTAPDTEEVHLIFDGVEISSSTSAPLLIEEADKVFVTLAEGSQNTLTDKAGSTATIGTGTDETNIDGTIFSKSDLTLNGSGSLTINGNTKHGIVSKDDLIITGGTYDITAAGQGLSGKDAVKIKDGTFTLTTSADAIQSDNAEEAGRGFVYIADGEFTIDTQQDAIQAETLLQIDGGTFDIIAGGGSENAVVKTSEGEAFFKQMEEEQEDSADADAADSTSMKGLKTAGELIVNNGTITIDAADDTVHSDGNLTLTGGTLTLVSGDDGLHADGDLLLNGANVAITESYEGIEGKTITISAGEISVKASDDGLNASSGSTTTTDQAGADPFSSNSENKLIISGGTVSVDSSGDGLDSNGTLEISGGNTTISGPENSGNGTIDSNGEAIITGGTLVGSGSSGMAETFSENSTQTSVLYGFENTYEAGSEIIISDSEGNSLLTWTADKSFNSVQFSSDDLTVGETYTISIDDEDFEVTIESTSTTAGITTGQMGGGMQQPREGMGQPPANGDGMQKPGETETGEDSF